jgi:hypothetical protein
MPNNIATCMTYTRIDPYTKQEVYIAKSLRDRKMQRTLMQWCDWARQTPGQAGWPKLAWTSRRNSL